MFAIKRYKEFLIKKTAFSTAKVNRICYAAESIINDATKLFLLITIGFCIRKIDLFVSILLTYTILRPFLGGMHKETYWGCFFSMLGLLLMATSIVLFTPFGGNYTVIYTCFLCIIGINVGPVCSPKRRKMTEEGRKQKKRIAMVIHIAIALLYILCREEVIRDGFLAGLWLVHSQVIIQTIMNQKGERKWKMC